MNAARPLFVSLWLCWCLQTSGQQFGGNPPSLKWRQINTEAARIIFPAGLDTAAQQVAAIVNRLSQATLPTIGHVQRKVNIVFQNQTTIANGYVQLAPFRSEFQLTPEQNSFDLGSLPWQKMLAIHEYRHVQQYNNFRVGLSAGFYYLFGEGGQALANSLAVPNWFWEGDAVYQETLVSDQGRGRLPYFFNSYRALWAGNKQYSWMKLRNGSLRDYVPDWYPLGYMLVAYGRQTYGDSFWRKVGHDAAAFHPLLYPLQGAIRRYSGLSFPQFRERALDHFRSAMPMDTSAAADRFARAHRHFDADEEFPQFIGADSLLYIRSTYKQIPAFVVRDLRDNKGYKVRTRAISLDNYFSLNGGLVVYAAYETDPRWGWRDYSVIRVLDPYTGEDRKLTSRTRYFSPDISPDGRRIVTVLEATNGWCELRLLDPRSGEVVRRIPNPDSLVYSYPKFFSGGDSRTVVTAVRNRAGEMSMALVDTGTGSVRYLLPFSYQTVGYPSVHGDTIWFTGSRDGQDRTYALVGERLFHLGLPHGEPFSGQYEFHPGPGGLYSWNSRTAVGFHLDTAFAGSLRFEPLDLADWSRPLPVQGILSLGRSAAHLLDSITSGNLPEKKYPVASHLINIHSWRPYINDPDYTLSLASENILNTFESEVFVTYDRDEDDKQVGVNATYGAWFPLIDAGWNYTFGRNALYNTQKVFWNESNVNAGFSIPLNWTRHLTYTNLQFGSDIVYNQRYYTGMNSLRLNSQGFAYIDPFVNFVVQSQQAQQQIGPRWAGVVDLAYSRAVTTFQANQFLASGFLYLPGLWYTHSLMLAAAFQQRDTLNNARFTNSFPFSRGYAAENFYRMWRWSANYQLPLVYPEWGVGNIVYFTRIRTNLYYDYTKAMDVAITGTPYGQFRSFGSEIYFDTNWWNELPISFGIRYSRLLDPDYEGRGPNQWELILPLNILSQGYSARKSAASIP
ncbi:MAG TPA: hypothetical protein VFE32_10970 [Puia sp.]|jgi:hypothetical protein|nr:hypothetical protein [Puia sp.]